MIDDKIIQQWMRDFDKEAKITMGGVFIKIATEDGENLTLNIDEYLQYRLNQNQ